MSFVPQNISNFLIAYLRREVVFNSDINAFTIFGKRIVLLYVRIWVGAQQNNLPFLRFRNIFNQLLYAFGNFVFQQINVAGTVHVQ